MKRLNLKNNKKLKRVGITAVTTLAAGLIFGLCASPIVAAAEQKPSEPENVKIDVMIKETENVYSIALTETENGGYTVVCDSDDTFAYEVSASETMTTVYCAGLSVDGDWTYELNYTFVQTADGEDNENLLSVTKGADVVEVKLSFGSEIIYYDAYLEGEEKSDLSAVLSDDCTSITIGTQENKAVAASDVMTVKIIIPDQLLVEDFENTWLLAEIELFPKIYMTVAIIVMISLAILGIAMLFVAG